jgi:polyferredoxin
MSRAFLADAILVAHFGFVLFVVGGFALIVAGGFGGWGWVRNRSFRITHLAAILFVAAESLAGIACPLTVWEDALRRAESGGPSFVGRWVGRLLYYDFPEWVFVVAYVLFALAVIAAWRLVPPSPRDAAASPARRAPP